ncbi:hypothetical protein OF83DRAFT_324911 [Amylostereum chailletii]|nr:hypothetical protein OF83DRAFT_324911 [Amylostereum chailletii]
MAIQTPSSSRHLSAHYHPHSATAARPPTRPKRQSDVFKPRLPLDPFTDSRFRPRDPFNVPVDRLYAAASAEPRRDVFLVVGAPSAHDLAPLLFSERLAFSLLIVATHQPPTLPSMIQPAVRILHLGQPLGLEQTGAVRFVNVLEWAERIARFWRKNGGIGVHVFLESDQDAQVGALTPPPTLRTVLPRSTPPSPRNSSLHLDHVPSRYAATASSSNLRLLRKREPTLPAPDPSQRPFDAIINFLPPGMSDKSMLKHAILVTTISRPFLVAAAPPPSSPRPKTLQRKSFFRNSVHSLYSMPPTPPLSSGDSLNSMVATPQGIPTKSHLVHLHPGPPPKSPSHPTHRFLQSIESFLLSFSFPPVLDGARDGLEPARAYILDTAAFSAPLSTPSNVNVDWTLADAIMNGCLDVNKSDATQIPRAYFATAADVRIVIPDQLTEPLPTHPSPRRSSYSTSAVPEVPSIPAIYASASTPATPSGLASATPQMRLRTASTPVPVANPLPTPPDSEEDTAGRSAFNSPPVAPGSEGKQRRRWRFWRRGGSQ